MCAEDYSFTASSLRTLVQMREDGKEVTPPVLIFSFPSVPGVSALASILEKKCKHFSCFLEVILCCFCLFVCLVIKKTFMKYMGLKNQIKKNQKSNTEQRISLNTSVPKEKYAYPQHSKVRLSNSWRRKVRLAAHNFLSSFQYSEVDFEVLNVGKCA